MTILTSNRTRELNDAVKRRCLYHWLDYPERERELEIIRAQVPQKELYHYSSNVRALTSGRGRHEEAFSHYAELAADFAQRLLAELKAKRNGEAEKPGAR